MTTVEKLREQLATARAKNAELRTELARLKKLALGLAARVAAQAKLLSKKAERPTAKKPSKRKK